MLSKLYFSGQFTNLKFMAAQQSSFEQAAVLNSGMQRVFRSVARKGQRVGGEGRFFDHHAVPLFHTMKDDLLYGKHSAAGASLAHNVATLGPVAETVKKMLAASESGRAAPPLDGMFASVSAG